VEKVGCAARRGSPFRPECRQIVAVFLKSEMMALPPGLSTRTISRQARSRPSRVGILWMHRLERTASKLASGKVKAVALSFLTSTRAETPARPTLRCIFSSEFPERSVCSRRQCLQLFPVVNFCAAPIISKPRPVPTSRTVSYPVQWIRASIRSRSVKLSDLGVQKHGRALQ